MESPKVPKKAGLQVGIHEIDPKAVKSVLGPLLEKDPSITKAIIEFARNNGKLPSESQEKKKKEKKNEKKEDSVQYILQHPTQYGAKKYFGFALECYKYVRPSSNASHAEVEIYFQSQHKKPPTEFFIFFLTRGEEVFALTEGDTWRAVSRFSTNTFPFTIAKKLLDTNLSEATFRHLSGYKYLSYSLFRKAHQFFTHEGLHKLIKLFSTHIKKGSLLEKFFKDKILPIVEISTRQIKFKKNLHLEQLVEIIDFLLKVKNGDIQVEDDPLFNFLDRIQLVNPGLHKNLEGALIKKLFKKWNSPVSLELDFCYREYEKYKKAIKYRFRIKDKKDKKNNRRLSTFEPSFSLSAAYIIEELKKALPALSQVSDENQLKLLFENLEFGFKYGKNWTYAGFLDYFHGEISFSKNKYFKMDGRWYQISEDYLRVIQEDFQTCLKEILVTDPNHPAALPEKWTESAYKRNTFSKDKFAKIFPVFPIIPKKISDLLNYLRELGYLEINNGKYSVTDKIKTDPFDPKDKRNLEEDVYKKFIVKHNCKIVNFLTNQVYNQKLRSSDEEDYNNLYQGKDGYLVGDKTKTENLELFDLIKIGKDESGEDCLFIYHIKIGIGQKTRDVISQIVNSLQVLNYERRSNKTTLIDDILSKLVANKRIGPGEKDQYKEMFISYKMAFVFGSMNDSKTQRTLIHEKDRHLADRTKHGSNIARLELIRAVKNFRKTDIKFYIFEIEKKKEETKFELKRIQPTIQSFTQKPRQLDDTDQITEIVMTKDDNPTEEHKIDEVTTLEEPSTLILNDSLSHSQGRTQTKIEAQVRTQQAQTQTQGQDQTLNLELLTQASKLPTLLIKRIFDYTQEEGQELGQTQATQQTQTQTQTQNERQIQNGGLLTQNSEPNTQQNRAHSQGTHRVIHDITNAPIDPGTNKKRKHDTQKNPKGTLFNYFEKK